MIKLNYQQKFLLATDKLCNEGYFSHINFFYNLIDNSVSIIMEREGRNISVEISKDQHIVHVYGDEDKSVRSKLNSTLDDFLK